MEIRFTNKEESKQQQRDAFLSLSPSERFYRFLELMQYFNKMPSLSKQTNVKSFEIVIEAK